jgi:hypothetical protein
MKIKTLCEKIGNDLSIVQKRGGIESQWPFLLPELEKYIGADIILLLNKSINDDLSYNKSIEQISKKFKYPSKIAQYILFTHSFNVLDSESRIKLIDNLIKLLEYLREDYLCNNGINKLSSFNIERYIVEEKSNLSDILLINTYLYSYCEKLYPTLMRLGYEYHGPYIYNNKKYIVKEYFDLDKYYDINIPSFKVNNIKIIQQIEGEVYIDFFGHIFGDYKIISANLFIDNSLKTNTTYYLENIQNKYLQLNQLFKDYEVLDYAKNVCKGILFSINRDYDFIENNLKIIHKLDNFKLFFPKEKAVERVNNTSYKDLQKSIFNSFYNVFVK